MGTVHELGSALWQQGGRPARPEAQALLDVPAAYGGRGAWIDRSSAPQLRRLLERCRDDMALYRAAPPKDAVPLPDELGRAGAEGKRFFFAGLFDSYGELCAVVDVVRPEPQDGRWWIGLFLVRPDLRGRGIGGAVVEAIEDWARAEGGRAIFLAVQCRNAAALQFARRTGFVHHSVAAAGREKLQLLVRQVG